MPTPEFQNFMVWRKITTEEVMDKLDMFQSRFGKIYQFVWWYLERISEYAGTQFTPTEFKEECQTCGVHLTLAAPEHQEMNGQVELTWRTLRTVAHSLMVHARLLGSYVHFSLMYTTDHIIPVLPIKVLIRVAIQQRHKNWQQVRNLQYHIDACYFFHVLYGKLRCMLRQRS